MTLRAYEVYKAVYGSQEAMITGGCRGGFGVGELIAFLYAHSFPQAEWRVRVDEAFDGLKLGRLTVVREPFRQVRSVHPNGRRRQRE